MLVNRSATWATWNGEDVAVELAELKALDIELASTGFEDFEINSYLDGLLSENNANDDVPDIPVMPTSRLGDVWLCDGHRVLCGDATLAISYETLFYNLGKKADMIWTDPPYNVGYEGKAGKIKNDAMADADFSNFLQKVFTLLSENVKLGGAIYVAHADAGQCGITFRQEFLAAGFKLASCLVWQKNQAVLSRSDYHWQHEPILYGWLKGAPHTWVGDRKQVTVVDAFPVVQPFVNEAGKRGFLVVDESRMLRITGADVLVEEIESSVISVAKPQRSEQHPTMKPVSLVVRML